jgi:gas vesicle protein
MGQTAEDLRAQLAEQRQDIGYDLEAIGDRVSPGRMVERRQAAARMRFGEIRDRVMGAADSGKHGVHDTMSSGVSTARDSVSGVTQGAAHATEGNPLAMGLVAFGAGLVAATLFPATRAEQRVAAKAQPTLEHAAEEVAPKAREVAGQLKEEVAPVAKEAVSDVTDSAKEAAQHVKEDAQSAARDTGDEAKREAKGVSKRSTT